MTLSAAGNVDKRTRHIGCLVGEQPEDRSRHFLRRASALHRHELLDAIDAIRLTTAGVDVGIDEAAAHSVDANALLRDLARQTDRERVYGALRGGVVDILIRRAIASCP